MKNQLQALALNQGVQRKWKLWSAAGRQQLEALPLLPWASRRRAELLVLLDQLGASIGELDSAAVEQAHIRPAARRLMTHPGVGPITALAFALTMGPVDRFRRGKQVASYLGLIPREPVSYTHLSARCDHTVSGSAARTWCVIRRRRRMISSASLVL